MPWMDGWQMGWMWIGPLVFLVLIALVVWAVVRGLGTGAAIPRAPEDILKERYARGEIDRDEYQRRLSDLRQ